MKPFPDGARHIFENTHQIELVFCEEGSLAQEQYQSVINLFNQKKSVLCNALWEVDHLLDTEQNWILFTVDLIQSSKHYHRDASRRQRERRKNVSMLRGEIGKTAIELVKQIRKFRELAMSSDGEYLGCYDDPSACSVFSLMGMAADCQNEFKEYFGDESCSFRDELEADMFDLIYSKSSDARPEFLSLLMAFASLFNGEEKIERSDGCFDPLSFSRRTSPGDFIRAFTSRLKWAIRHDQYPERLKGLSFRSIETFAGVLFPHPIIKAGNYIDLDWNPIKDVGFK